MDRMFRVCGGGEGSEAAASPAAGVLVRPRRLTAVKIPFPPENLGNAERPPNHWHTRMKLNFPSFDWIAAWTEN